MPRMLKLLFKKESLVTSPILLKLLLDFFIKTALLIPLKKIV